MKEGKVITLEEAQKEGVALLGSNGVSMKNVPHAEIPAEFALNLVNADAAGTAARIIALNPGKFDTIAELASYGLTADGILADGTIVDDAGPKVTGNAKNASLKIDQLVKEFLYGAFRVERIIVNNQSNTEAFQQVVKFSPSNAFQVENQKTLQMEDFFSEFQNNTTKITMDLKARNEELILSKDTVLLMPIVANSTTGITLIGKWLMPVYPRK